MGVTKHREPFKNLLTQGMVKGKSYKLKKTGQYIHRDNVDFSGIALCCQCGLDFLPCFNRAAMQEKWSSGFPSRSHTFLFSHGSRLEH